MSSVILIAGGLMIVIALVLLAMVFMKANQVNLTEKTEDGKPEWMHAMPPKETVEATTKDGEGVALFDHDEGEQLAAPFAEQIEDVLRAKAQSDPYLKSFDIDFGTAADGGLEVWVNGKKYNGVASLPDEKLKQTLLQAVKDWNSRK